MGMEREKEEGSGVENLATYLARYVEQSKV